MRGNVHDGGREVARRTRNLTVETRSFRSFVEAPQEPIRLHFCRVCYYIVSPAFNERKTKENKWLGEIRFAGSDINLSRHLSRIERDFKVKITDQGRIK